MRSILIGLLVVASVTPALARGPVHVHGYTTKRGTYVAPHYRSAPDHSRYNNWSTYGNVNPYTGKVGTKHPYSGNYSNRGYAIPSYNYEAPSRSCPGCSVNRSPLSAAGDQPEEGAIYLPSGVVKVPAETKSGYCLRTPPNYVATGDLNYPVVTGAMPRCESMVVVTKHKKGLWQPLH